MLQAPKLNDLGEKNALWATRPMRVTQSVRTSAGQSSRSRYQANHEHRGVMPGRIERRLEEMQIVLPKPRTPVGSYVAAKRAGALLFLSGKGPIGADGRPFVGKVGETVTTDEAYRHARLVGIELIAAMRDALGDLDRVEQIVKVFGFVNAAPTFAEHPKVINGCSDLFAEVFGESGRHARTAAGASSLPFQITVEIEAIALVAE